MNPAPILLFVYNRPWHTSQALAALAANKLAAESELFIYADGPKAGISPEEQAKIDEVRTIIQSQSCCKKVTIKSSGTNLGLAGSIIKGVTETLMEHDRVIVLEDDLVTSPYFLQYMNEALEMYATDDRVACIHGYVYPIKEKLPETFFLRGTDCWGWATWKKSWDIFEKDGQKLLDSLLANNLSHEFDYDGNYPYMQMLTDQIKGKNNSWAIRWHASAYLKNKLTLYPGRSLVHNIGIDSSGVHSAASSIFDVALTTTPVQVLPIPVEVNTNARMAFVNFFRSIKPNFIKRFYHKLKLFAKNATAKH